MIEVGKSTLDRMRATAEAEQLRIEAVQDALVARRMIKAPHPELVAKRDDFAGMVRLIDKILSNQVLFEQLSK